jgi:guanine deaminase
MTDAGLSHDWFLAQAIEEAVAGVQAGHGGPFGALVVRDGRVLGRGHNRVTSAVDPTAHAEVVAIRDACAALGEFALPGAVLYASCEPCPMCAAAIYWARIERTYYAATRSDAAQAGFDDAALHERLAGSDSLPLQHIEHPRSGEPFRAWAASAARVPY